MMYLRSTRSRLPERRAAHETMREDKKQKPVSLAADTPTMQLFSDSSSLPLAAWAWRRWMKLTYVFVLVAVASCKTANPAVCCLDAADCASIGVDEAERSCAGALACVDHECVVPDCSKQGCAATAPVCNLATDVCEGCLMDSECSRFPGSLCDEATGECVQCSVSMDCPATTPVCDAHACRVCKLDSECSSGACGDDGLCTPEASIVYIDPGGSDFGDCPKTSPCRGLAYAATRTTPTRNHIVFATGAYAAVMMFIDSTAPHLYIHGRDATLSAEFGDGTLLGVNNVPVTIRDLELISDAGTALAIGTSLGPSVLERVRVGQSSRGILVSHTVTMRDVKLLASGGGVAIDASAGTSLTIDRGVIGRWDVGIKGNMNPGVTVKASNLLVYGCETYALDLTFNEGLIEFSTIVDSGSDQGTGPRAVACSAGMTFRSSIVWAPGVAPRAPIGGCNLASVIAGPTAVPGASSADPLFVDPGSRNYRLRMGSPARDAVDVGPSTDLEALPRPRNGRFDLGAYEAE